MKKAWVVLIGLLVASGFCYRLIGSSAATLSDISIKTVAIVITDDPQSPINTVPDTINITLKDRIQWVVVDIRKNGGQLNRVVVGDWVNEGTQAADNPFGDDADLSFGPVSLSNLDIKLSKEPVKTGTFKYNVTAVFDGQSTPVVLDPQMIVGGGG